MDRARLVEEVGSNTAQIAAAVRENPHAAVWEGTGWDRTQLAEHVAQVYGWMGVQLRAGPATRVRFSEAPPLGDGPLPDVLVRLADELTRLLSDMDVDAEWTTWAGPQPGSFYPRRMAQESAIHRWDTVRGAIDPELAADGVSELLEIFAPRLPAERFAGTSGTLHLQATDTGAEWRVALGPERVTVEPDGAGADVSLRGAAGDVVLWAWNRIPVDDRFAVAGDADLLEAWRRIVVF